MGMMIMYAGGHDIAPTYDDVVNIGSGLRHYKNAYFSGAVNAGTVAATSGITIEGQPVATRAYVDGVRVSQESTVLVMSSLEAALRCSICIGTLGHSSDGFRVSVGMNHADLEIGTISSVVCTINIWGTSGLQTGVMNLAATQEVGYVTYAPIVPITGILGTEQGNPVTLTVSCLASWMDMSQTVVLGKAVSAVPNLISVVTF
jgi:hypothetical protein